jgi:hypothetical protein
MPACPRDEMIAANDLGIDHVFNRCVRRAFLCGCDPVLAKNYND